METEIEDEIVIRVNPANVTIVVGCPDCNPIAACLGMIPAYNRMIQIYCKGCNTLIKNKCNYFNPMKILNWDYYVGPCVLEFYSNLK